MQDFKTFDPFASSDENEIQRTEDDQSWVMLLSGVDQGFDSSNSGYDNGNRILRGVEGTSLQTQVFPDSELHEKWLLNQGTNNELQLQSRLEAVAIQIQSELGRRVFKRHSVERQQSIPYHTFQSDQAECLTVRPSVQLKLPIDFLRIPAQIALQLRNPATKRLEWKRVEDLQNNVMSNADEMSAETLALVKGSEFLDFSCVISRRHPIGLGMTLCERDRMIFVLSVLSMDGRREMHEDLLRCPRKLHVPPISEGDLGPAQAAGLLPGDRILGLNGRSFDNEMPLHNYSEANGSAVLKKAGEAILNTSDPIVLHIRRYLTETLLARESVPSSNYSSSPDFNASSLRQQDENLVIKEHHSQYDGIVCGKDTRHANLKHDLSTMTLEMKSSLNLNTEHPLVKALRERNLLQESHHGIEISKALQEFKKRTRQWDSRSSFFVNSETGQLYEFPNELKPLPSDYYIVSLNLSTLPLSSSACRANVKVADHIGIEPERILDGEFLQSTTTVGKVQHSKGRCRYLLPRLSLNSLFERRSGLKKGNCICIPLSGIKAALNIRIVHYFLDGDKLAYIIWVYDNETGKEWYVPTRYFQDFVDLRVELGSLAPCIYQLPFPFFGWSAILRGQARLLQPSKDVMCKQLEDFLRCISGILYTGPLCKGIVESFVLLQSFLSCNTGHSEEDEEESLFSNGAVDSFSVKKAAKIRLKRSIQRYAYQLFLLPLLRRISDEFIQNTKKKAHKASQLIEVNIDAEKSLKDITFKDLQRVKDFLDQMQTLILDGCKKDFIKISREHDFSVLGFTDDDSDSVRDSILIEGLREQLEIELYVPIRSVISRQVVNSWRKEDREIQLKIQLLKNRPQSWFKISKENQSITEWDTVSSILSQGVGRSTLPCVKLRAIVQAAKEIVRLHAWEHSLKTEGIITDEASFYYPGQPDCSLGADEFLPIFIFSVVHAELDRPFALCTLLKSLCEQSKCIGETGYYLASFEAAIEYLKDIDVSDVMDNIS